MKQEILLAMIVASLFIVLPNTGQQNGVVFSVNDSGVTAPRTGIFLPHRENAVTNEAANILFSIDIVRKNTIALNMFLVEFVWMKNRSADKLNSVLITLRNLFNG